mgnify:CR=1 FL=1
MFSCWYGHSEELSVLHQLPLVKDARCDVVVVGAGMAGMSVAYFLAREGRSVIVLDDGPVGGGMTGLSSGHLSYALEDGYVRLEALYGLQGARLAAQAHGAAVAIIEDVTVRESIDCDFLRVDGYLFNPPGQSPANLEAERAAAERAGVEVEWEERAPLQSFETGHCLRFPDQAQFHPLRYLAGLTRAFLAMGGKVHTQSYVKRAVAGSRPFVETDRGCRVDCSQLVLATNSGLEALTYRSYVMALRIPPGSVQSALYWDSLPNYHYVRVATAGATDGSDLLIAGGEDHRLGEAFPQLFSALEKWTRRRFPMAGEVDYLWSGQVFRCTGGPAWIGPGQEENSFVVTGGSGHGLTHGTVAGQLIADLVCGRPNPWTYLYAHGALVA